MKKRTIYSVGLAVLTGAVLVLRCANPVDEPPLKWRSNVEAPITNERFIIGEEFDNLFEFDELDIINVAWRYYNDPTKLEEDTIKGDTVVFSTSKTDSSSFESHEDTLADKHYHVTIGAIAIQGAPEQHDTIPVPAVPGSFSAPVSVTMQQIYTVNFYDTASNVLQVDVTNTGSEDLHDIVFGIGGLDTARIDTVAAGATERAELNVAGKTIRNTADFFVAGTTPGDAGMTVVLDYSLNGLVADSLQVDDHLINFTVEFENAYELTDTVKVDYIDIGDGFFSYEMRNYTGLDLLVEGIHQHMWVATWAEGRGLTSVDDLTGLSHSDSVEYFYGKITDAQALTRANADQEFSKENISNCRLFAEWIDSTGTSVTKVKYIVSSGTPTGDTVTLSASDSLRFTISTGPTFKFKEMMGTLMESYERQSDTQKVAINLPWNNSVKDSLRGRFILEQVWGDVLLNTDLPERAFLDTLKIDFVAFSPESVSVRDSTPVELINVTRDSAYFRSMDITDVANLYSDSVAIAVKIYIPQGTRMRIVNDLDVHEEDYEKYIGRMIINVKSSFRLNAKLDWTVDGMVNMDLGSSRFEVLEAMRYFSKLEDRSATFEMWLRNYSNLNLSLLALAAPDALMDTLDSLTMNEVYLMLIDPELAQERGYVNLFGDTGIVVPPRDTTTAQHNVVLLDNDQLERMFTADSLNFRWWVQFREQDRDAMSDTDFVDMRSRLGIEGINNTDSLLIWE